MYALGNARLRGLRGLRGPLVDATRAETTRGVPLGTVVIAGLVVMPAVVVGAAVGKRKGTGWGSLAGAGVGLVTSLALMLAARAQTIAAAERAEAMGAEAWEQLLSQTQTQSA